jgi:hypothetical protein
MTVVAQGMPADWQQRLGKLGSNSPPLMPFSPGILDHESVTNARGKLLDTPTQGAERGSALALGSWARLSSLSPALPGSS